MFDMGSQYKCRYERLTLDRLRQVISYDPETGIFRWLIKRRYVATGDIVSTRHNGHIRVSIDDKNYLGQRLAWLYMTGSWPCEQVDHINGIRDDNRWINLRACTDAENKQNIRIRHDRSLPLGVTTRDGVYRSRICANGIHHYLGTFGSAEAAHQAYLAAKARLHTFNPVPRELTAAAPDGEVG